MTKKFILDENIFIFAQLGTNAFGENDLSCTSLIQKIIDICYGIILDVELYARISRQLNRPHNQRYRFGAEVLMVLADTIQRPGKIEFRERPPSFPEEADIPQGSRDDTYIVRLAVETGATLVTADEALRDDLATSGITERYSLQVVSPQEALNLL